MQNRLIPALLIAAALAFACGPHPHGSAAQSVSTAAPKPARGRATKTPAPVLSSNVDVKVGDGVTFALNVTNKGSKLAELTFPTGQTHDFVVLDAGGQPVWRWSEDRMFTQSLQNKLVSVGDTVTYEERMGRRDLHGTYTLVATLHSSNHPVEQRLTFTLP